MALTKTQRVLILEGVRPGIFLYGSGGGRVIADPRTIRALVKAGLAFRPTNAFGQDWRDKAYLTRAAFELVGAEPPKKHPFDIDLPWP
jgi:hypothetical protein